MRLGTSYAVIGERLPRPVIELLWTAGSSRHRTAMDRSDLTTS